MSAGTRKARWQPIDAVDRPFQSPSYNQNPNARFQIILSITNRIAPGASVRSADCARWARRLILRCGGARAAARGLQAKCGRVVVGEGLERHGPRGGRGRPDTGSVGRMVRPGKVQ